MTRDRFIAVGCGVGVFALATVLFVVLKVTGTVDWSWALVFAPLWIPTAMVSLALLIVLLIAFVRG